MDDFPGMNDPAVATPAMRFGYKTAWFAIKSEAVDKIAQALDLHSLRSSNWQYGVWHSVEGNEYQVFVTPPVKGWVLAAGVPILYEADNHAFERVTELSDVFGEAQLFGSMRVSSVYLWAKAINGRLVRSFYEGDGERRETGKPASEESEMIARFFNPAAPDASQPGYWERKDLVFADEAHVLRIADQWSVNPMNLDEDNVVLTSGLIGKPGASYPPKPLPIQRKKGLLNRLLGRG